LISTDWSSPQLAFIHIIQKGTRRATKRLYRKGDGATMSTRTALSFADAAWVSRCSQLEQENLKKKIKNTKKRP